MLFPPANTPSLFSAEQLLPFLQLHLVSAPSSPLKWFLTRWPVVTLSLNLIVFKSHFSWFHRGFTAVYHPTSLPWNFSLLLSKHLFLFCNSFLFIVVVSWMLTCLNILKSLLVAVFSLVGFPQWFQSGKRAFQYLYNQHIPTIHTPFHINFPFCSFQYHSTFHILLPLPRDLSPHLCLQISEQISFPMGVFPDTQPPS